MVSKISDFLGRGFSHPFRFTSGGAVKPSTGSSTSEGIEHVKQALIQLYHTNIGERVILRDYGSDLGALVFHPQDEFLISSLLDKIKESTRKWEKRVIVNSLDVLQMNPSDGKIVISVNFTIIKTNVTGNLVFPYYVSDANRNTIGVVDAQS